MDAKTILILTAVQMENRAVYKEVRDLGCVVRAVGIGAKRLEGIDVGGISLILMCGLAGGLDPALKVGDVVLDDPGKLLNAIAIPCHRGPICSIDAIVDSPASKAQLFASTGALAVDMEQKTVLQLGLPVIGIRAISDTAHEMLDPDVVRLVNDLGRPRPMRIASALIQRPQLIPYLQRLNKNTKLALANLVPVVRAAIETLGKIN